MPFMLHYFEFALFIALFAYYLMLYDVNVALFYNALLMLHYLNVALIPIFNVVLYQYSTVLCCIINFGLF